MRVQRRVIQTLLRALSGFRSLRTRATISRATTGACTERLRAICKRLFMLAVVTIVSRQPEVSESPEAQRMSSLRDASDSLRKESTSMSKWNDGSESDADDDDDDDEDEDAAAASSEGDVSLRAMHVLCIEMNEIRVTRNSTTYKNIICTRAPPATSPHQASSFPTFPIE